MLDRLFHSQVSPSDPYVMTLTHCRRGGCRHRVSNKHLAAGRDEFISRSGDRPEWMLDENLHHTSASRESSRRMPGCLIRTFRYLTIIWAHQHGGYYYLGREAASQEMVSPPGRAAEGEEGVAVHRFMTTRRPGVVAEGQQRAGSRVELHQHGPELCLPRLSGIVAIDRGLYHRVGMRAGPRVPVHGGPRTPALPSFLPSPISISKKGRKHVTTSGCRPTGRFSTWQEPRCGTVSGDSTSCSSTGTGFTCKVPFPPTPRYRTASTSGGSLPCSPATWVCSVHIAWQQPKQEKMGNPSSPSPLSYPPLRRLSRRSGKLGSSRAITEASSHTARETETLGTEGSQPHVPAPGSRPPGSQRGGLASCATHQRSSTDNSPALARRPGISHPHCLADVEIQAPDAEK